MLAVIMSVLVAGTAGFQLTLSKNIMIMNNSYYSAEVIIDRVNPEYTPSRVAIEYSVQNVLGV